MAKRNRPAQTRARRERATDAAADAPPAIVNETANDAASELPTIPEPGDVVDQAQREEMLTDAAIRSVSMSSEPSEEDIRLRAYQRYLERGGGHGLHFDDWLAAERELKKR